LKRVSRIVASLLIGATVGLVVPTALAAPEWRRGSTATRSRGSSQVPVSSEARLAGGGLGRLARVQLPPSSPQDRSRLLTGSYRPGESWRKGFCAPVVDVPSTSRRGILRSARSALRHSSKPSKRPRPRSRHPKTCPTEFEGSFSGQLERDCSVWRRDGDQPGSGEGCSLPRPHEVSSPASS
jgi:hypothetical protein